MFYNIAIISLYVLYGNWYPFNLRAARLRFRHAAFTFAVLYRRRRRRSTKYIY